MAHVNAVQVKWTRDGYAAADAAVVVMHWRGAEGWAPDVFADIDSNRRDHITSKITTWWNAIKARAHSGIVLKELRFYDMPSVYGPVGDVVDVRDISIAGTGSAPTLALQSAVVVTLETDSRRTWGRWYLPLNNVGMIASTGLMSSTYVDAIANASATLCARGGFEQETPVVWSRREWTHHDPQKIRVTDEPGVIRSRRTRWTYKKELTL